MQALFLVILLLVPILPLPTYSSGFEFTSVPANATHLTFSTVLNIVMKTKARNVLHYCLKHGDLIKPHNANSEMKGYTVYTG